MVSTGNHFDRFVRAYNAYRRWEAQAQAQAASLVIEDTGSRWNGEHVATVAELPVGATEGQVVFVGDFPSREGEFWELVGGRWQSVDAEE